MKPLRLHVGEPITQGGLLSAAPIPMQVPSELCVTTPTDTGATITFKNFLYRDGKFYPIHAIKELKK